MSVSTTEGKNLSLTDGSTDVDQETLLAVIQHQQETIEDQQETIGELRERLDAVEDRQAKQAKESAKDRQRLTDVEDRLEDIEQTDNTHPSDGENTTPDDSVTPETPLEQTARLPEEMIEEESANVRRAIFVARDVADYTKKVPAGRAIKSSELRTVLQAGTDAKGHSQTVERVMTILDDMGGDDVEIVDRRGERRVVFSEAICERLERLTNQQGANTESHKVVTQGRT